MNQKLTLILMAGLPGAGKSTIAHALSDDLRWRVVDKDKYRKEFIQQSFDEETASYRAYEAAFAQARNVLAEEQASVILDCVGLHKFILETAMNIVRCVENARLKVILCVVDRDLRKDRLSERPAQRVVLNEDLETHEDYFNRYKLPRKDTYILRTDKQLEDHFENRSVTECLAEIRDFLDATPYALSHT